MYYTIYKKEKINQEKIKFLLKFRIKFQKRNDWHKWVNQ